MKKYLIVIAGALFLSSCIQKAENKILKTQDSPIIGTWRLLSGKLIKGKDTTYTDYTKGQEMIKIINKTHFAFLRHDLKHGIDSTAIFSAGAGEYFLNGNKYTEHLQYFVDRQWEDHKFEFEYKIEEDTLVIKGIERIEELGIDQLNIETYIREKE